MENLGKYKKEVDDQGFTVVDNIYTTGEINEILSVITDVDPVSDTFRKSSDLFAIRQFLKEVPMVVGKIFNDRLKSIVTALFGEHYFVVKSIYFDKPPTSNWYVPYHQDLTISVDKKIEIENFGPWTKKQNQFAVQPPVEVLENIFTIRVHLDDTDEENGALNVVPGSHLKKVYRAETINWNLEKEVNCAVAKGGIMIMKPLLLHSSRRTTNNRSRRVIHIEFSSQEMPNQLNWSERLNMDFQPSFSKNS